MNLFKESLVAIILLASLVSNCEGQSFVFELSGGPNFTGGILSQKGNKLFSNFNEKIRIGTGVNTSICSVFGKSRSKIAVPLGVDHHRYTHNIKGLVFPGDAMKGTTSELRSIVKFWSFHFGPHWRYHFNSEHPKKYFQVGIEYNKIMGHSVNGKLILGYDPDQTEGIGVEEYKIDDKFSLNIILGLPIVILKTVDSNLQFGTKIFSNADLMLTGTEYLILSLNSSLVVRF